MKINETFASFQRVMARLHVTAAILFSFLLVLFACQPAARAQIVPSGFENRYSIAAGGTISGYDVSYGSRQIAGPAAFVDIDTRHHLGVEGEARWLVAPQTAQVHNTTWLVGARYATLQIDRRFLPYAKGLIGFTQFNFPYSYAKGDYLVIAPGGGIDYRISRRVRLRLADFEYQFWPQFTFGNVSSWGLSTGVRVKVY